MNSNSIIQSGDKLYEVYGKQYEQKINFLQNTIANEETGKENFKVLDFEAGLGKSRYTDIIIRNYIHEAEWDNRRKFLIVKKFNEDSINSAAYLESSFLKNSTLAITADNWNKEWKNQLDELANKRVLIISHKRYFNLCLDDEIRSYFTKGRHTLIIDEKMTFPIYTYNDGLYTKIHNILPNSLRGALEKVCKDLNLILLQIKERKRSNSITKVSPKIKPERLQAFLMVMAANKHDIKNQKDKALLEYFLEGLELWYSNTCVANAGNISICNSKHKHWGLENNIILDASGAIDGIYSVDDKYSVQRQTHFIDHKDCEFVRIDFNTSKSNLENHKNKFFPEMCKKINELHSENEKTLIVVHKRFSDLMYKQMAKEVGIINVWKDKEDKVNDLDYEGQSFAIAWFGNLIGKNTFSDFNNIWVLGTPNIPLEQYLIQYMQYAGQGLGRKGLNIYKGRFKNDSFRDVQEGYIIAEIYQTLKRIQRNPNPKGKFYIANHDEEIVKAALKGIRNATLTNTITLDFVENDKQEKEKVKKPIKAELVRNYVLSQKPGTIIEYDALIKKFKITNMSKIINHQLMIELRPQYLNKIKVERKKIIIL